MITPEISIFAALASIFGVGIFSFVLPKVIENFKDMNYRLMKEIIEIREQDGTLESEKSRFDRILAIRRKAYLENQERLFEEFYNERMIDELKTKTPTHNTITELSNRKRAAKKYSHRFCRTTIGILLLIMLSGGVIVAIAWMIANVIVKIF